MFTTHATYLAAFLVIAIPAPAPMVSESDRTALVVREEASKRLGVVTAPPLTDEERAAALKKAVADWIAERAIEINQQVQACRREHDF